MMPKILNRGKAPAKGSITELLNKEENALMMDLK